MAKKSIIAREKKRTATVARYSAKRQELKRLIMDISTAPEQREEAQVKFQQLPRDSSPVRQRRRCQLSGRPRGVYRKFGLSRNFLRLFMMRGDVPGGRKASW